jgi:hypothetical protein
MAYAQNAPYQDIKKLHALETMCILVRCIFAKNPTGWEVMEIFAGSASESDKVFTVWIV